MNSTPASTPAERRREKVRTSILEAAEAVFVDEGAEGVSIRRIADAIDYSPAAIYKYFASKEELLDELKEAFFAEILQKERILEDHPGSFQERARLCLETYIQTAVSKSRHYAAAFAGIFDVAEENERAFLDTNKGQAFTILLRIVDEGKELGLVRKELPRVSAAKSLWASCHGLASLMAHVPNFQNKFPDDAPMSRDEFIAFHVDQTMRGLEVAPSTKPQTKSSPRKRTK